MSVLFSCGLEVFLREDAAVDDVGCSVDLAIAAQPRLPQCGRPAADLQSLQTIHHELQPSFLHDHDSISLCWHGVLMFRAHCAVAQHTVIVYLPI